ncbi:MAG: outer membrane lipoprotein-sorting protein [Candidatus Marinimicrobia bacterium]|nr:outer membrane lipoprotein-sorting protein [Candidatus Neomarinimicrobiota bacterium]MCF7851232.1 outer membrane lipoprotein-sorting protein [Candidatus Neomarinimicrobiota bacterium]
MKALTRTITISLMMALPLGLFAQTAYEIAKAMDEKESPADMKSKMTMTLTNKQGKTRESTISSIAADDNRKQIIWFLSPPDDKGVAFLKIEHADKDDEMRLWLPAFKKVRRISSKKKADSFMGSDLSYEDMTSRELEEYTYELKGEKIVDGVDCYILESTPKEGITRTYKRFITYVSKADMVPILDEAYDMRDKLLKRRIMKYSKQKGYELPKEIYVENVQKEHNTRLVFKDIEVDTGVEEDLFQEKNLKRLPR